MKKPNKENSIDTSYRDKIKDFIKQKVEASISELDKNKLTPSRQTLRNNLRILCNNNDIRVYIKVKHKGGFMLPREDEIFFAIINKYEVPQDILNLINELCSNDIKIAAQAFDEFIKMCLEKAGKDESPDEVKEAAKKYAYLLMSGAVSGLKEKIAYNLATGKKPSIPFLLLREGSGY